MDILTHLFSIVKSGLTTPTFLGEWPNQEQTVDPWTQTPPRGGDNCLLPPQVTWIWRRRLLYYIRFVDENSDLKVRYGPSPTGVLVGSIFGSVTQRFLKDLPDDCTSNDPVGVSETKSSNPNSPTPSWSRLSVTRKDHTKTP